MSRLLRASCVALLISAFVFSAASPAAAVSSSHVFILWLDGTTLQDWTVATLPNFHRLLGEASIALLSTRTANESTDPTTLRLSAAISFGAAAQSAGEPGRAAPLRVRGATPGLLGDALKAAGLPAWVIGDANGTQIADQATIEALIRTNAIPPTFTPTSGPEPSFLDGMISDVSAIESTVKDAVLGANIVLVDPGDTERVQRAFVSNSEMARAGMPLAMQRADAALGVIRAQMSPHDLLIVVSGSTSVARQRKGIRLSVVAIQGPGFGPGVLTSGTTRRDGIISLTDLAPTIVDALGLPPLSGVTGRVATFVPRARAAQSLASFERDIVRASLDRYPLTRWTLIAAMLLVALALAVTLFAGPAPSTKSRLPRGARDWVATLLVAAAATPLSLYLNGVFHPSSAAIAGLEAGAVALGLSLVTRAAVGLTGSLVTILCLTALVPLIDLLIGTPLGVRSPLAFQVAGGGRFYGIDGGMLGVVIGAEIFAAALLLERAPNQRSLARWIAVAFAATVWLLGAPSYGSKFGAALTAVPAFGVLGLLIAGRRLTRASVAAIAIATVAVTGLLIGVDALRKPGTQSHVARAVEGHSSAWAIITRKAHLQWVTTFHTIWTPAILVFAGAIAVVLWRRRDLVARALEWHTLLRPALLAALVGGIAGFLFNDGGVLTTAPIAMFAAVVVFSTLLSPG